MLSLALVFREGGLRMDLLLLLERKEEASGLGVHTASDLTALSVLTQLGPGVAFVDDAVAGRTVLGIGCVSSAGEGGPISC